MAVVKRCPVCGVVKSLDDYHRHRARHDGRAYQCKDCASAYIRRYREENRAKIAERKRRYNEENRDKIRERKRRYYEENRDKIAEKDHRYREENLEYTSRRNSRRLNRYQSVTKSAATKRGPWSEAEVAILMADDGRTLVAKALELGRTYSSCHGKRAYLRRTGATN